MGDAGRLEAHEVAGADLERLVADLGTAAAAQDEQELLVPLVAMIDEALLAGRHPGQRQDGALEAGARESGLRWTSEFGLKGWRIIIPVRPQFRRWSTRASRAAAPA